MQPNRFRSLVLPLALVLACSAAGTRFKVEAVPEVFRIDTGLANVYLIKAETGKLVMVDASGPPKQEMLVAEIEKLGLRPADIALVIITHGHADHAGNAAFFKTKYGTKIAAGRGDLDKFSRGKTDLAKDAESIGLTAKFIRGMSDADYPPFQPDVIVDAEVSLEAYGVRGKIAPLPGHTPGSIIVSVGRGVFVGDLIRGGILGGETPTEHFFHEDRARAREQLAQILKKDEVSLLFPGHFGPLKAADVRKDYLK